MTINPLPNSYTSQALGHDSTWNRDPVRELAEAAVSTQHVDFSLGPFGLHYSSQNISFAPQTKVSNPLQFAQEMELNRLTQHIAPYRPAGASAHNATIQRLGLTAYAQHARPLRAVPPMISVNV